MRKTKSWSRNCSSAKPCFTCSGDKTKGALWRLALMRTPVLGPRFPPAPTGIPDEIGLWPQHVRNCECWASCQDALRSEEHTSELQSHLNLVCRLLLEKKKTNRLDVMREIEVG